MSERGTKLTSHQVNELNETLEIIVADDPGVGGANHLYLVTGLAGGSWVTPAISAAHDDGLVSDGDSVAIYFQNGPVPEHGANGVTHEVLLAILIDRLEGFQSGKFASKYNETALNYLKAAQNTLKARTAERLSQGIEGTLKVAGEPQQAPVPVHQFKPGDRVWLTSGGAELAVTASHIDKLRREHVHVTWRDARGVAQQATHDADLLTNLQPEARSGGSV